LIIIENLKNTIGNAVNKSNHTSLGENVNMSEDTLLGEGATVGNNVTFYPGVVVGQNCKILDGAVIGRLPIPTGTMTRPVDTTYRELKIGAGSVIGANSVIYTGVQIGEQALIGDLASLREGCSIARQAVIGRGVLVMYNTTVGERTRVIDGAILTGHMVIESDVFIGPGVNSINDNDVYLKRFGLEPFEVKGPLIRRFALIGAGAILAAGISIGVGSIVAPGALVTRDVPDWKVVMGIPARVTRDVDPEARIQITHHFGIQETDS
jgi:acetyltransferase-like isoleucine patch superfamily enzyme